MDVSTGQNKLVVGVLAIQGAFKEHEIALLKCSKQNAFSNIELKIIEVKEACHLKGLDGLVIPGGESTSIGKIVSGNMLEELSEWSKDQSHMLFGTCAGLIMLSKNIENKADDQLTNLGILDVTTSRNFFGRQLNSFEGHITVKEKALVSANVENDITEQEVCNGVFIRAPAVLSINGSAVKALATVKVPGQDNEVIVGVQDKNCIGLAFHPELTEDLRWHAYFLKLVMERKNQS